MALTVDGNSIITGPHVPQYPWENQKREHQAIIEHHWGGRCDEYELTCGNCNLWRLFDAYWAAITEGILPKE